MMSKRRALIENATAGRYTVCFYNGNTLLQTVTDVPRGGTAVYTGTTPTTSNVGWEFTGWNPAPTKITRDMTCYAQFADPYEYKEITDTWAEIFASIDNGTYLDKYKIGNYKPLDLGTEGVVNMQIVAFDSDSKPEGGFAPITWIGRHLLKTPHRMNPALSGSSGARTEGTGTIGGWEKSEMRSYLKNTIKPLIPQDVRDRIIEVTKYSLIYNPDETAANNATTVDDVWIPSEKEVNNSRETKGVVYSKVFNTRERKQLTTVSGSQKSWWVRSADNNAMFRIINYYGAVVHYVASQNPYYIALGFCT